MADQDDNWHDRVIEMADDLELTGNDRRDYIHRHMTKKGYRMEPTYVKDDQDDDDDDDGGFFGSSGGKRSRRSSRDDDDGDRGRRRSRGGGGSDNWYS